MHVQNEIRWREANIKESEKEINEIKIELQAYKKLLSKMKEKRIISKLLVNGKVSKK